MVDTLKGEPDARMSRMSEQFDLVKRNRYQKFAAMWAADSQVKYEEDPRITVPEYKHGTLKMPVCTGTDEWLYSFYNLIGQLSKVNRGDLKALAKYKPDSMFRNLLGTVAEHSQDLNEWSRNYHGRNVDYVRGRNKLQAPLVQDMATMLQTTKPADNNDAGYRAINAFVRDQYREWMDGVSDPQLKQFLDPVSLEKYELLEKSGVAEDLLTPHRGGSANEDLTNLMMHIVKMDDPEGQQQEDTKPEKRNNPENGKGKGDEGDDGAGDAEGDPSEDEIAQALSGAASDGGEENNEGESGGTAKAQDKYPPMSGRTKRPLHLDFTNKDLRHVGKYDHGTPKIIKPREFQGRYHDSEVVDAYNKHSNGLAKKLARELRIQAQVQKLPNQRRGKLNKKAVAKVATQTNDRVFQRKQVADVRDTAVSLVVDHSGSMGGQKYIQAAMCAIALNGALSKIQIPTDIWGFTSSGRTAMLFHYKDWSERKTDSELVGDFAHLGAMGGNPDSVAILHAFERIQQRKEKRKVIIVLSDGSPASAPYSGDEATQTKFVITQIHEKSDVEIYGIGIMDTNVRHFYPEYSVIRNVTQLEKAVLDVLRHKILDGAHLTNA